jgi:membrane associated rhomboid family serine protease
VSTKTTHLLIGLNILIFLVMLKVGGMARGYSFASSTLLQFGANYGPLVFEGGQWWRMLTACFIHITPVHILMNMIALYQVGVVLEPHYGRMRFVLIYLVSGLGGSVASLAWNWSDPVVSAGASGAISGLIAAGAVAGHMLLGLSKGAKQYRDAMVRWLILIVGYGFIAHVDGAGHAGGMVVGAAISWVLDRNGGAIRRAQHEEKRDRGLGLETLLLFAVVAGGFFLASRAQLPARPRLEGTSAPLLKLVEVDGGDDDHEYEEDEVQPASDELIARGKENVRAHPMQAAAHAELALLHCSRKEWKECGDEARLATRLDAKNLMAWTALSWALRGQGQNAEADKAQAEAEKLLPK